jgi:hypothetical protein
LLLPIQLLKFTYVAPAPKVPPHDIFFGVLTSLDDLASPRVATKIARLRILVRNRRQLLCASRRHAEGLQVGSISRVVT